MAPDVDIETLRLLVALERCSSIGAAARYVGVSQPAASARLREFEARWRLGVVERSARGSTLTEEGHAVVSWARRVLDEIDVMRASMIALASQTDELKIAASLTIAEFLLPRWIGELRTIGFDVHPQLRVVNSVTVASLVRAHEVDLGFIESTDTPDDLAAQVIGRDRVTLVVPPQHPWAQRSTAVSPQELAAADYVLRERGSGTRRTFEASMPGDVGVSMEATSTTALVGGVHAGLGIGVVSRTAVAYDLEIGRLVEVPHGLDLRRPLTAVWHPQRRLSASATELIAVAARAMGRDPRS
ncbi:LysR family transcriptional regulator [Pseudactinotalea terrae]|uniref:LysR family transcriptional regulator n=1 Tax=Pseudactinotalea terrae TaxID=1743262 RepID=UPI0012E27CE3|nr:LysR family transcriptional regulator [Pseudactinotalea terrae]